MSADLTPFDLLEAADMPLSGIQRIPADSEAVAS